MQKSNKDLFTNHNYTKTNNGWYGELSAKTKLALEKDKKPINNVVKKKV